MTEQEKNDQALGIWRVHVWRATRNGQWTYSTTNPQGGGFGTNTSERSLRRVVAQASRNIPPTAGFRLIVNDEDRGLQTRHVS